MPKQRWTSGKENAELHRFMYGAFFNIHIRKIFRLYKTAKKATKQGSRYHSVESVECLIFITGDNNQWALIT